MPFLSPIELSLLDRVGRVVRELDLWPAGTGLIAAVSGGVDSVVLLHLLTRLRPTPDTPLLVGHVHHGLRGEESDRDEAFVADLARERSLPFRSERLDPARLKSKGNLQENARRARYAALERMANDANGARIALGHHAQDQAETLLDHLLRGSGLRGLSGMAPCEGRRVRPLLFCPREEIAACARAAGLAWREDRSNESDRYLRNRLRKRVWPLLEIEQRHAARHMAETAAWVRESREALTWLAREKLTAITREAGPDFLCLDASPLPNWPSGLRKEILLLALQHFGEPGLIPSQAHLRAMDRALASGATTTTLRLPQGRLFSVHKGALRLNQGPASQVPAGSSARPPLRTEVELPREGEIRAFGFRVSTEILNQNAPLKMVNETTALFDLDRLVFPLFFRTLRTGDRIRLPNLGTRSVRRLLMDLRWTRGARADALMLGDAEGKVLWIPRARRSDQALLTPETSRTWIVRVSPEPETPPDSA